MTTYNTGNPVGSADPKDLYDNAENFDRAMNDRTSDYWTDRLGYQRMTALGFERSGGIQGFATLAELQASLGQSEGQLAYVTNDPDQKNNGLYRRSQDGWALSDINTLDNVDSLTINAGKDYPCEIIYRSANGPLNVHPYLKMCLLDASVIGARRGYSYRISFVGNGSNAGGQEENNGINITRIPNDRMADGYEENIVTYEDTDVTLIPDREKGGIQTFYIDCVRDPGTVVKLVIDVDLMPEKGVSFNIQNDYLNGYNARIIESNYSYRDELRQYNYECLLEYKASTSLLMFSYLSGARWYRIHAYRKGINQTFQLSGFSYADAYTSLGALIPPESADWVLRAPDSNSDFQAPVRFEVLQNGDVGVLVGGSEGDEVTVYKDGDVITSGINKGRGSYFYHTNGLAEIGDTVQVSVAGGAIVDHVVSTPPQKYSSGAHGTDSFSGGNPTAEQKDFIIYVDDIRIDTTKDLKVRAQKVKVVAANLVRASNTMYSGRNVMQQNFRYEFSKSGVWIDANYTLNEQSIVFADNACQAYMAGMTPITNNTYLFWGGNQSMREQMPIGKFTSGPKNNYPECYGVTIRHPIAGEMSVWVDTNYGIGDRQHLPGDSVLWDHSNHNGAKIYPRLFSISAGHQFNAGEGYRWRGGYYWGTPTNTGSFDAALQVQSGNIIVNLDGTYAVI